VEDADYLPLARGLFDLLPTARRTLTYWSVLPPGVLQAQSPESHFSIALGTKLPAPDLAGHTLKTVPAEKRKRFEAKSIESAGESQEASKLRLEIAALGSNLLNVADRMSILESRPTFNSTTSTEMSDLLRRVIQLETCQDQFARSLSSRGWREGWLGIALAICALVVAFYDISRGVTRPELTNYVQTEKLTHLLSGVATTEDVQSIRTSINSINVAISAVKKRDLVSPPATEDTHEGVGPTPSAPIPRPKKTHHVKKGSVP
jgi:hypothetical protein